MEAFNSSQKGKSSRRVFLQQSAMAGVGLSLGSPLEYFPQKENTKKMIENIKTRGYASYR